MLPSNYLAPPGPLSTTATPDSCAATTELSRRFEAIVNDPKYVQFARIPARIVRCLDHFGFNFDRDAVHERLLSHYVFIAVVDDAIDSGAQHIAGTIFDCLLDRGPKLNGSRSRSAVEVVTGILKHHIDDDAYAAVVQSLRDAYTEVIKERNATSMAAYIEHREALGRATAEQSYLLIRSALGPDSHELNQFMRQIGAIGCLVDSIIDLRHDSRGGLLGFKPTLVDFARLYVVTLASGLRVWARKPALTTLFVEAIIDNIRDRKRAGENQTQIIIERNEQISSTV